MADAPKLCPQCQAQVHPDWPFCSHCGSPLERTPPPAPAIPVCDNCGSAVDTSGAYCWKCGVPLSTGREPFIPSHPETDESPAAVPGPAVPYASLSRGPRAGGTAGSRKKSPRSALHILGGTLLLLGVLILIGSLLVSWYGVTATAQGTEEGHSFIVGGNATYYPLNYYSETLTCRGWSSCSLFNITDSGPYSQGTFESVGTLYDIVAGFVIAGIVLGLGAAVIAMVGRRGPSRWALGLAVLAILLALLAPMVLMLAQPPVISSQGPSSSGSGPGSSFFGSCSGSGCSSALPVGVTENASWGPTAGWYLALLALVPLVMGLLMIRTRRRAPASGSVYELTG